jgi:hypothetical protein
VQPEPQRCFPKSQSSSGPAWAAGADQPTSVAPITEETTSFFKFNMANSDR